MGWRFQRGKKILPGATIDPREAGVGLAYVWRRGRKPKLEGTGLFDAESLRRADPET
jgi:hypothetical protein